MVSCPRYHCLSVRVMKLYFSPDAQVSFIRASLLFPPHIVHDTCLMQRRDRRPPERATRYLTYIKKTHRDKELSKSNEQNYTIIVFN